MRRSLLLGLTLVVSSLAAQAQPVRAITDVTVIDVRDGTRTPGQTVVIEDGRIESVETDGAVPEGAEVIDGAGRYLIPGLWDMHAHVRHPLSPTLVLPQFIAYGVTGIRDMNSECEDESEGVCLGDLRSWQEQIEAGTLVGPRFMALSSFPLNPPWDYEVGEEMARGIVGELALRGVDLIKVYHRLSPEAFGWVADEADSLGLGVAGHLPMRMTAAEASDAGLGSLEHARDVLFDCFPGTEAFRASAQSQTPSTAEMRAMVDGYDADVCAETFATLVRNGTAYVPTHVTRRFEAHAEDTDLREDPRLRYVWPEVRNQWLADADRTVALDSTEAGRRAVRDFYTQGLAITGQAHDAGVLVLLGTDAGDSFVFWGSGAHDELEELVEAGLTPAQALAAATLRPAEFLGAEADYGTVEPGKVADLVLLRADPLTDIANVRQIDAVVFGGTVHDRDALDVMLAEVEATVAAQPDE